MVPRGTSGRIFTKPNPNPKEFREQLLVEWDGIWLESLKSQIYDIQHRRQLHDEFMEMLDGQEHRDTHIFRDAFPRMYVESQVMAFRRQADDDKRTLSLRRLIGQLECHHREFTSEWYVSRWLDDGDRASLDERARSKERMDLKRANAAFDNFTDNPGDPHLSRSRLQADRDKLLSITEGVVIYTNTMVAHAERTPEDVGITYADFHEALDHLSEMLCRYHLLHLPSV